MTVDAEIINRINSTISFLDTFPNSKMSINSVIKLLEIIRDN